MTLVGERVAVLVGGPEALVVESSVQLVAEKGSVRAGFRLHEGERAWFALTGQPSQDVRAEALDDEEIDRRLARTREFWREWAGQCSYDGPYRAEVVRSALTLKSLTNKPTDGRLRSTAELPSAFGKLRLRGVPVRGGREDVPTG